MERAPVRGVRKRASWGIGDIPLYDVAVGPDLSRHEVRGHAKAVVAIGDVATGIIAVGGLARGVIAIGGLAIGLVSLGGLSIGVIAAVGGLAIGSVALGGGAIGGVAMGVALSAITPAAAGPMVHTRSARSAATRMPKRYSVITVSTDSARGSRCA